jgi:hypothetical protein
VKMNKKATLHHGALLGLALLLSAGSASAQLFKWVDANGKIHFSDTPPPATAKPAPLKNGSSVGNASSDMPYALSNAMRNYPVTLYTTGSCAGCDAGRAYLRGRGIPFSEKTVSNAGDLAKLNAAGGDGNLPLLVVGSAKASGYQQAAWESMLNVAQYPAKKILPSTYQYPAPVAAAPAPAAAPPKAAETDGEAQRRAAAEEEEKEARKKAFAPQTAPPGFRF